MKRRTISIIIFASLAFLSCFAFFIFKDLTEIETRLTISDFDSKEQLSIMERLIYDDFTSNRNHSVGSFP